jgi:hypothetical protein
MRKESQRALLKNGDNIKVNRVGSDAGDGESFVSDDLRGREASFKTAVI